MPLIGNRVWPNVHQTYVWPFVVCFFHPWNPQFGGLDLTEAIRDLDNYTAALHGDFTPGDRKSKARKHAFLMTSAQHTEKDLYSNSVLWITLKGWLDKWYRRDIETYTIKNRPFSKYCFLNFETSNVKEAKLQLYHKACWIP